MENTAVTKTTTLTASLQDRAQERQKVLDLYLNDDAKTWLAALRSGEYTKATGYLSIDGCNCTLGVAEELFNPNEKLVYNPTNSILHLAKKNISMFKCPTTGREVYNVLSDYVQKKLGLLSSCGLASKDYTYAGANAIWQRNDDPCGELSLPEMANWIEARAEFLFRPIKEQTQ